ncbi:MAG: biliverdin-producing heme oxygenase [Holophagaceae bacterium]|nr:biliverdin-producing heme oxygenase [Holophagaceae bacterium]
MPQPPSEPLLLTLKAATWHRHQHFDRIPFITALERGTLPLAAYVAQLRALAIVVGALERILASSPDPLVARVRPLLDSRFNQLCADLNHLVTRGLAGNPPALRRALALAQRIRAAAPTDRDRLLGYLYVLEGTTLGNQVHLPDVRRCFRLQGPAGVAFYQGYGEATATHWAAFSGILNEAAGEIDTLAMLEAAEEFYEGLEELYDRLLPLEAEPGVLRALDLNPEAGDHPIPQHPNLLQAALRAGERCWEEFPYLSARYGERGLRFTDSDSAWLATLAWRTATDAIDQVLWLGRILARRGLPRLLLERQLALLIEELGAVRLPRRVKLGSLEVAAQALTSERLRSLPEASFQALREDLAGVLPSPRQRELDLPTLLTAALADQRAGLPDGASPMLNWASEQGLVAPGTQQAVRLALGRALS